MVTGYVRTRSARGGSSRRERLRCRASSRVSRARAALRSRESPWPEGLGRRSRRRSASELRTCGGASPCGLRRARGRRPARRRAHCVPCTSLAGWPPSQCLRMPSGGCDPARGSRAPGSDRRQGQRRCSVRRLARRPLAAALPGHIEIPVATPSLQARAQPAPPCSARPSRDRTPTLPDCRWARPHACARLEPASRSPSSRVRSDSPPSPPHGWGR